MSGSRGNFWEFQKVPKPFELWGVIKKGQGQSRDTEREAQGGASGPGACAHESPCPDPYSGQPVRGKRDGGSSRPQLLTLLLGAPGVLAPPPESRVTVEVERSIPQQGSVPAPHGGPPGGISARS